MCFIIEFLIGLFFLIVASVMLLFYRYQTKDSSYWEKQNVPCLEAHWLFGSFKEQFLKRKTYPEFVEKCYSAFKGNGFGGVFIFRKPAFFVCDSGLIEKILVQDFDHFHYRFPLEIDDLWSNSLFTASGEKWRLLRVKLAPAFSSGKVKSMFEQMLQCSENTIDQIREEMITQASVEVQNVAFTFVTEAIASCSFGVQLLSDETEAKRFKGIIDVVFKNSTFCMALFLYSVMHPKLRKFFGIKSTSVKVAEYFSTLTKETIAYRINNRIERNDFLQTIMSLYDKAQDANNAEAPENYSAGSTTTGTKVDPSKIFNEDLIGALFVNLLSSGIIPTQVTISFALYEIANHPDVQKKLHKEIESVMNKHKGLTYDAIGEMTYLDEVIQETLRLYPYNPMLIRTVTKKYAVPHTSVTLDKGLYVYIPTSAIHRDPDLHPSPEVFKPERFSGNNYKASPTFMPFGLGPRTCISIKFALTMVKVCLARILSEYSVNTDKKCQSPFEFDKSTFVLKVKGGIWLVFEKRSFNK